MNGIRTSPFLFFQFSHDMSTAAAKSRMLTVSANRSAERPAPLTLFPDRMADCYSQLIRSILLQRNVRHDKERSKLILNSCKEIIEFSSAAEHYRRFQRGADFFCGSLFLQRLVHADADIIQTVLFGKQSIINRTADGLWDFIKKYTLFIRIFIMRHIAPDLL